jgi:uncharacterized protein (DUF2236 family)
MDDEHDRRILRRHAADGTLMAGGGAAILLQLADPRVAAGVSRHSGFRERPLDRLAGTHQYLMALAFGDDRDIRHVVRLVDARHARVRGVDPRAYDARDADAQRWVAATLLATALHLEERLGGRPLEPRTADALVRGFGEFAARLQGADAGWPASRAEFEEWWAGRVADLEVGADARAVARDLLSGSALPAPLRALMPAERLITAALLPPAVRDAYGFRWTSRAQRIADAWLDALGLVRRMLPRAVLALPARISLRRLRRRSRYAGTEPRGRG